MIITTVGQLRSLIKDLPDEMTIIPEVGPDLDDALMDLSLVSIKLGTEQFFGSIETRCDDVQRLYLGIDAEIDLEEDEESTDEDDENEEDEEDGDDLIPD